MNIEKAEVDVYFELHRIMNDERKDKNPKPMKYIDSEKLIAEIERLAKSIDNAIGDFAEGRRLEQRIILSFITSLQQEQLEELHFPPLNRLIQKIPSENWNDTVNNYARKLRDCLIREGYRKDAEVLQDYISYMNGNNVPMATMDEQEQPEVDLETYIENEVNHFGLSLYEASYKTFSASEIERIMRKFYELGLNARKEKQL